MFQKCLSVFLAFALMLSAMPITVFAETTDSIILDDGAEIFEHELGGENGDNGGEYDGILNDANDDAQADVSTSDSNPYQPPSLTEAHEGEVAPAEREIIYTLRLDAGIQDQEIGTTGAGNPILNDTPHLTNSGNPTFTIVENPVGGNSLQISGRDADWHTIDLVRGSLGLDVRNTYTVTVEGRILGDRTGAQAQISRTGGSWGPFVSVAPAEDGTFVITLTVDAAMHAELAEVGGNGFRIRTNGNDDFIIDEIIVSLPQVGDVDIPEPGVGTLIPESITLSPNRVRGFEVEDFDV